MPLEMHPSFLVIPAQRIEMGEGAVKERLVILCVIPGPNGPLSQCLIHVMRVTFSQALCVKARGDGIGQSKGACVSEVSDSHV